MPDLSLVFPYYRNAGMLRRHLDIFMQEWSPDLRKRVEVMVVDDGSPADEAAPPVIRQLWTEGGDKFLTGLPRIQVFRITEDRLWHQHAARNCGAHEARTPWLLMTDIDHVVPPSTLDEVLRLIPSLRSREVLTFGRVDAPAGDWRASEWRSFEPTRREDGSLKPHVNSFAISRKWYWRTGGYDESYCGIYGCDREFRDRLFTGKTVTHHLDHAPLIRVGREVIADASTRDVDRKTPERHAAKKAVQMRKLIEGRTEPLVLNFPWERVI